MTEQNFIYPASLLKIESGQQFKKGNISLLNDQANYDQLLKNTINRKIEEVIALNKGIDGRYSIEFPEEIKRNISDKIKQKVVKELTGYEVRLFTAIVKISEIARMQGELHIIEKINRNAFDTNLSQIYNAMGIGKGRNKIDAERVLESLISLHRKEFIYKSEERIEFGHLVQLHNIDLNKKDAWKNNFVLSIASCFNYKKSKEKTYFNIPHDLNSRLRKLSSGRPNASIEILIKYMYQSKHCTKNNRVEYTHSRLCSIMNLSKYKANNNYSRIKKTLDKGFKTCIELGIVSRVEKTKSILGESKYIFYFD